jgi:hypothetical protein
MTHAATSKVKNSAQGSSCKLKFVHAPSLSLSLRQKARQHSKRSSFIHSVNQSVSISDYYIKMKTKTKIEWQIRRVTRLGKISPFGQFFMAKFFLEKIAQWFGQNFSHEKISKWFGQNFSHEKIAQNWPL